MLMEDDKITTFGPTIREVHTTYRYFLGDLLAIPKTRPILMEINRSLESERLGKDFVKRIEDVFKKFDLHLEKIGMKIAKHVSKLDFNSLSSRDKKRIEYIESAVDDLYDAKIIRKLKTGDYALDVLGKQYLSASLRTKDPLQSFHRLVYFRLIGYFLQQAGTLSQFLMKLNRQDVEIDHDKRELRLKIRCPRDMIPQYVLIDAEGRPHLSRGAIDNNYPHSLSLEAANRFLGFTMSLRRELFNSYSQISGVKYSESKVSKQASVYEQILSIANRPFLVRESEGGYTRIPDPALPAMVSLTIQRCGSLSDIFDFCRVLKTDFSIVVDPEDVLEWVGAARPSGVEPKIAKPLLSQNFSRFISRLDSLQLARQEADGRIALRLE